MEASHGDGYRKVRSEAGDTKCLLLNVISIKWSGTSHFVTQRCTVQGGIRIFLRHSCIENQCKWLFLYESIYGMAIDKFLYLFIFFREIVMRTRHPGGNGNFSPGKNLARGEITISPRVTSAHDDFTEKKMKRYRNLSMAIAYIDSYRNMNSFILLNLFVIPY